MASGVEVGAMTALAGASVSYRPGSFAQPALLKQMPTRITRHRIT
jgi:hypothetical protein